jgi:hypothetical protein
MPDIGEIMLKTMLAVLAGTALAATAQDVTFTARTFDNTAVGGGAADPFLSLFGLSDGNGFAAGTTNIYIGSQPISIAYSDGNVYIGGNDNAGALLAQLSIAEINDVFGTPTLRNVQGSVRGVGEFNNFFGRGYSGMDWSDRFGLLATYDRGSAGAPAEQVYIFNRTNPGDTEASLQVATNGIRGISGPSYDYGFNGLGFTLADGSSGPVATIPSIGDSSPFGLDPTSFDPLDDVYGPAFPDTRISIFDPVANTSTWRDWDIHPSNGAVVARANNWVTISQRTIFNGSTGTFSFTPPNGPGNSVNQNIAIIHNPACGVDMVILNDRASSSVFQPFANAVYLYDMNGNPLTFEINLPGGGTFTGLAQNSNIYNFFWDEDEQLLFILDGFNRALLALDLDCGTGPVCTGDIADDFGTLGADGQVSFGDFLALLGLIGPCPGGTPGCTGDIADDFGTIGGDGQVSFGDFLALLGLIGPCP